MQTNKFDLPEPIVKAIANDDYDPGASDITASSLWAPPRIRALRRQHKDEIHYDAADGIYALIGKSIHNILEKSGDSTALAELRLFKEYHGWRVSGKFDRFVLTSSILQDWKVTSVYSILGDLKFEWIGQTNTYADLLRHHNIPVSGLQIVAILRDWSKREARKNKEYPQKQVVVVDLPLWSPEEAAQRIGDRVLLHQGAELVLPLCSDEDRWKRSSRWAVIKNNNVKATKTFATEDEGKAWLSLQKDAKVFKLEHRPGEAVRCLDYCDVAPFCSQWQEDPDNLSKEFKEFVK